MHLISIVNVIIVNLWFSSTACLCPGFLLHPRLVVEDGQCHGPGSIWPSGLSFLCVCQFCIMLSLFGCVKNYSIIPELFCSILFIRFPLVSLPSVSICGCLCPSALFPLLENWCVNSDLYTPKDRRLFQKHFCVIFLSFLDINTCDITSLMFFTRFIKCEVEITTVILIFLY